MFPIKKSSVFFSGNLRRALEMDPSGWAAHPALKLALQIPGHMLLSLVAPPPPPVSEEHLFSLGALEKFFLLCQEHGGGEWLRNAFEKCSRIELLLETAPCKATDRWCDRVVVHLSFCPIERDDHIPVLEFAVVSEMVGVYCTQPHFALHAPRQS